MTPQHIVAAQREYAARKWLAGHSDRYCSTYQRFTKFADAVQYLREQAARVAKDPSQYGTEMRQDLEGPGGLIDVTPLLLPRYTEPARYGL